MWIRINPTYVVIPARSDRAGVTGAFKKDRHCFERRFDPPFFRSHESLRSIRSYATWVNLFLDEADVAAACSARESNTGKIVCMYAKPHVFVQIACRDVVAPHHGYIALSIAHNDIRF